MLRQIWGVESDVSRMWGLFVIPLAYAIVVMFKTTELLLLLVIPLTDASVMLF